MTVIVLCTTISMIGSKSGACEKTSNYGCFLLLVGSFLARDVRATILANTGR
jgi:hypothetical protein